LLCFAEEVGASTRGKKAKKRKKKKKGWGTLMTQLLYFNENGRCAYMV
jgi:hypothetical protein